MYVRWLTAFFDFLPDEFGPEVTFWRAVSGSTVSPPRGAEMEFATLEPFNGDPYLRVQRLAGGRGGMHLDLHVDDPHAAAEQAVALGAALVADYGPDAHITLTSPAGGVFCLVPWTGESAKARPIRWPGGGISIIDQLWFDVPADVFDAEVVFWASLTGQETPSTDGVDEVALTRRPRLSLQVVVRRSEGTPRVCVAVAATNVPDETERHVDWGARVVTPADAESTVEMADPSGRRYFITKRNPRTGV